MKKMTVISMVALVILVTGCADKYKKAEKQMKQPINCATAEADIRMLEHEKAHVQDQIAQGVTAITPAGAVIGILTKSEGTKLRVGTGEYNKMIDKRIAEIKAQCSIR